MMVTKGNFVQKFIKIIGADFLELPYAGENVSMIIGLPKKGQKLQSTLFKINVNGINKVFDELKLSKAQNPEKIVEVIMPRFEIKTSVNLVEALKNVRIFNFSKFKITSNFL